MGGQTSLPPIDMNGKEVSPYYYSYGLGAHPCLICYLTRSYPFIVGDCFKNQPLSHPNLGTFHRDHDNILFAINLHNLIERITA